LTIHTEQTLDRAAIAAIIKAGAPAQLVSCELDEADLSRLDFTGWSFDKCSFKRTNLTGATLESTVWTGCRGAFADFRAADLAEAKLQSCDFNNASFRAATLSSALIRSCKMTGADFTDAKALEVTFEETLLIDAKLPSVSFRKLTLNRLDFSRADLRKADFRDAVLDNCSLREANVSDARAFRGAVISREQAGLLLAELGLTVR
jgi:fluoroquinolone resistance protein